MAISSPTPVIRNPDEPQSPRRQGEAPSRDLAADSLAIERVLQAERDAEADVARALEESEAQVNQARHAARRVSERADERIRWLRGRLARATDDAIVDLRREHDDRARESERNLSDPAVLRAAVGRVVAWLLGDPEAS